MTEHSINLTTLAESLKNGDHSIFSASGSGLWMNCAGGLLANLLAPDNSGAEAAEGTVAHGVGEQWLKTKKKPKHLVGTKQHVVNGGVSYEIEITDEMLNYVQEYFDMCDWLPGQHFIETKVYYSEITPIDKQGGTADHVACSYQRMVLTDLKYGKGVYVEVMNNPQLWLYALGFFYEYDWLYDFQEIEMRVCQPRMGNFGKQTITRAELLAFAETAKVAAHAAWKLDAPRTPGAKQCQFCKVASKCAANFSMQVELTAGVFDAIDEPVTQEDVIALKDRIEFQQIASHIEPFELTTEEMASVYQYRSLFEGWWKKLHNELNIRAARGERIPGMKLVEGRKRRVVRDHRVALLTLEMDYDIPRSELIQEEFASPAEIERLLRKHGVRPKDMASILEPLVHKPRGKATLVSETDRRDAIVDLTEDVFDNLDFETEMLDSTESEET